MLNIDLYDYVPIDQNNLSKQKQKTFVIVKLESFTINVYSCLQTYKNLKMIFCSRNWYQLYGQSMVDSLIYLL